MIPKSEMQCGTWRSSRHRTRTDWWCMPERSNRNMSWWTCFPADDDIDRTKDQGPQECHRKNNSETETAVEWGEGGEGHPLHFLSWGRQEGVWQSSNVRLVVKCGRFRAETEGLIIAAQDEVVYTASFRHRIIRDGCDPTCGMWYSDRDLRAYPDSMPVLPVEPL